jgi:hypothetical protein
MGHDLVKSMSEGINRSTVVLICASQAYQNSDYCMFELNQAVEKRKPIVTMLIEENQETWARDSFTMKTGLETIENFIAMNTTTTNTTNTSNVTNNNVIDSRHLASKSWSDDDGLSRDTITQLNQLLELLTAELILKGASRSLQQ